VSRQVIWEAQSIDQAAGFLRDDPDGVREMLDAVARLAEEPALTRHSPTGHLTGGGCASAATG
jgi:mRNA interferase RelE/StbE